MIGIVEWAQSKQGFYVDRQYDAKAGKWDMTPGPIRLSEYQARILEHVFTVDGNGRLPYDTIAWCEPAKAGKSAIAALVAEYVALHLEKNTQIVLASNKQLQAQSVMFESVSQSVEFNPSLRTKPDRYEIHFKNGNTISAIASSARTSAGLRFSLAVFDELAGYVYSDLERLWSEFKTDPTRQICLKLAIGYAGYLESKLWLNMLQKGMAGEPVTELADIVNPDGQPACWRNGRQFTFWSHACRQPWQTEFWKQSLQHDLSANEYSRMVECRFVEGEGNFMEPIDWKALIDPLLQPLKPNKEIAVYVGLDLALSPKGDDCALIGCYRHPSDRVAIAFHKLWQGKGRIHKLKLGETVMPHLLKLKEQYNLVACYFDKYQAEYLSDELRKAGINMVEVPQNHSVRGPKDTYLQQLAQDRRLMLYPNPELETMVAGASAREIGNSLIFLKKASGRSQIDLLVALSNCADQVLEASYNGVWSMPSIYDHSPEQTNAYLHNEWNGDPYTWETNLNGVGGYPDPRKNRLARHSDNPAHIEYAKRHGGCEPCYQIWARDNPEVEGVMIKRIS